MISAYSGAGVEGRPGLILFIQTFGNLVAFNPHIHVIAADRVLRADGVFVRLPAIPAKLGATTTLPMQEQAVVGSSGLLLGSMRTAPVANGSFQSWHTASNCVRHPQAKHFTALRLKLEKYGVSRRRLLGWERGNYFLAGFIHWIALPWTRPRSERNLSGITGQLEIFRWIRLARVMGTGGRSGTGNDTV